MSVTLEKRRKVAELENFEKRILQEKQRLLRELESLERPFRKARSAGWTRGFSSDAAGAPGALYGAGLSRAPAWFYIVAAIILFGGGVLAAHFAWRGAPAPHADGATLRQAETPTTPARIEPSTPAPENETAQSADASSSSAASVSVAPVVVAPPAPPISDSNDLKQRLLEAQSAAAPLPEPLPPPLPKAQTPDPAPAQEAGPVTALDETQPHVGVERAAPAEAAEPTESPRAVARRTEEKQAVEGRRTQCLVKVDGSVLFDRGCTLRQPGRSTFTFDAGGDDVVLTLERGRTWTASLGGRSLGKVYRSGNCWGRRRDVYICAKGA
ncbi:MAG: hypothetical protein U1E20_02680 [Methylocystis sp.]|uniref:hypothetical protein n=1 Tax=Methylocystis sp. TaxID=1911079 RepID=UPI003945C744